MKYLFEIVNKVKKSVYIKNLTILAGSTVISRLIYVFSIPIISRLYNPDSFGILSVYVSLVSFILIMSSLNYEAAIPIAKDDEEAINLIFLCIFILLSIIVVITVLIYINGGYLLTKVSGNHLIKYRVLFLLSIFAGSLFLILNWWFIRKENYKIIANRKIMQSLFQSLCQVLFPFFIKGPTGLLVGDSIGRSTGTLSMLKEFIKYIKEKQITVSVNKLKNVSVKFNKFPKFGLLSIILHRALFYLPPVLLAKYFGNEVAGYYGLVNQVIIVSMEALNLSISQIFYSESSKLIHNDKDKLFNLFILTLRRTFMISFIPMTLLLLFGPWIFQATLGEKWYQAGIYARLLSIPFLIMFTVGPVFTIISILQKQKIQLVADFSGLFLLLFGFFEIQKNNCSDKIIILICGVSIAVKYLLLLIISIVSIKSYANE
ncbi:MAG: oligosaccharide flippase family protein [Armatimonadota bacterium]